MEINTKILIGIFCISILLMAGAWMNDTHRPYTETVVLERQYIGNITNGVAGSCDNCLIMEVSDDGIEKTYYFGGENELRSDLVNGYPIKIHWEYIHGYGYYRIRDIHQPVPKDGFTKAILIVGKV